MIENELNVWFSDKHVGYLWPDNNNTICFQYTDKWLDYKYAFQISPSLPLTEEPFGLLSITLSAIVIHMLRIYPLYEMVIIINCPLFMIWSAHKHIPPTKYQSILQ